MKNYAFVESGHVHIVSDEAMIPKGAKWIPVDTMDVAYVRVLPDGSPALRSEAEVEQERQAAAEQAEHCPGHSGDAAADAQPALGDLACEQCGQVVETDGEDIFAAIDQAAHGIGFEPRVKFVEVSGTCQQCAKTKI